MTKTQKRCLIGSMLLHGTLLASLFVGSAFMKKRPKEDAVIMFAVDPRIIEGILSRDAGNPNFKEVKLPPPSPLPPAVAPEPVPEVKQEPVKEPIKEPA